MGKNTLKNKIRVGFLGYDSLAWMGGVNYLKNLLFAVKANPESNVKCYVFIDRHCDPNIVAIYRESASVIFINELRPIWFLLRSFDKLLKSEKAITHLFNKYQIDVLSHNVILHPDFKIKSIAWFPDFQHLHLPDFIGREEVELRNRVFLQRMQKADRIILSSKNAFEDLQSFAPKYVDKADVLNFVSQIDEHVYDIKQEEADEILNRYNVGRKYFFLPNQFWKHKNHIVVFKAVNLLKKQGVSIQLVCTGNLHKRDTVFFENINQFIRDNDLTGEIKQLGLIKYNDLQCLMRYAISVINPSLFEGWSSTVEECKSLGKNMIISDIGVHREQAPPEALFFDPRNETLLSEILLSKWNTSTGGPDYDLETRARESLAKRTIIMALDYEMIIKKTIEN
jgi:glycosyltransferase involved in cell wall biosynthesis